MPTPHINPDGESLPHDPADYRALFENADQGIARLSRDLFIEQANAGLARMLNHTAAGLIGQSFHQFSLPEDQEKDRLFFTALINTKEDVQTLEKRFAQEDGTVVWGRMTASVVAQDTDEPRIVLWIEDITARKAMEHQLKRQAEALRQSNHELEQFAMMASHDLSSPLDKISAFSQLLLDVEEERLSADGRLYLDYIQESAVRMQKLIAGLLSLSLVTAKGHTFEPVDLNRILKGVVDDVKHANPEQAQSIEVGPLPTVSADAAQMHQLFQNLISNALKFSKPGAPNKVVIDAETKPPADGGPAMTYVHVRDNGIGFTEEQAHFIFGAFKRLHPRHIYDGSGMGLAICKKIVERHHGHILAHGVPGEGAQFTVRLPLEGALVIDPPPA